MVWINHGTLVVSPHLKSLLTKNIAPAWVWSSHMLPTKDAIPLPYQEKLHIVVSRYDADVPSTTTELLLFQLCRRIAGCSFTLWCFCRLKDYRTYFLPTYVTLLALHSKTQIRAPRISISKSSPVKIEFLHQNTSIEQHRKYKSLATLRLDLNSSHTQDIFRAVSLADLGRS